MKLPHDFYLRDARDVARDLLGKELVRVTDEGMTSGIIVETEAYLGIIDKASHAYGGRTTRRTAIMYEEGGKAYIYFIYGMYWCLNITTREAGIPEAVLIRALEPLEGKELMLKRRKVTTEKRLQTITNGPGKLCIAMSIDGSLNGEELSGDALFIREGFSAQEAEIVSSRRVNIDYAEEAAHFDWRYFLRGNHFISRP